MALVRCEAHGKPEGRTRKYVTGVKPLGYPETAAVCGLKGCDNPGVVWLTAPEQAAYRDGQRVFALATSAVKIRAS